MDVEVAKKTADQMFKSLSPKHVSDTIAMCLKRVYSDNVVVGTGYFSFLISFMRMKKGISDLTLPIMLNIVLYKLGHDSAAHREQVYPQQSIDRGFL
jgi:hypothetical protein